MLGGLRKPIASVSLVLIILSFGTKLTDSQELEKTQLMKFHLNEGGSYPEMSNNLLLHWR